MEENKQEVHSEHGSVKISHVDKNVEDFIIPEDKSPPSFINSELLKLLKKEKTARHVLRVSMKETVEVE